MNVSLTPELENYVLKKSQDGLYNSVSEVIRQALRLFIETEHEKSIRLKQLSREINIGLSELSQGEKVSSNEVFDEIRVLSAARRKSR